MNRIVRDHYKVADLPEDLRAGLLLSMTAKVVIEVGANPNEESTLADLPRSCGSGSLSSQEIQAQIDAMRGESDD